MATVKVKNLKTGTVRDISPEALKQLKRLPNFTSKYDVLEMPTTKSVKNAQVPKVDKDGDGKRSAKEVITAIEKAETIEAIETLIDGEGRKTVLQAANARQKVLKK